MPMLNPKPKLPIQSSGNLKLEFNSLSPELLRVESLTSLNFPKETLILLPFIKNKILS